jgi:uncharacterized protein YqhQ
MNQQNSLNKIDFAVGGQAVIEGVMMRSPNFNIVSVRHPGGKIEESQEFYQNLIRRKKYLNIPVLRGVINMLEMMLIGTKALNFSSRIALADLEKKESSKTESTSAAKETSMLIFSVVFALAMSLFLFKFLPLWLTDFLSHRFEIIQQNYLVYNLLDGVIKSTFFVAYIALLSLLPDVRRVFQYHGAEHKSIMTYEQGLALTVENAQKQTRFHPRCGTSFILIVFLLSVFVFTAIPRHPDFLINFAIRMAFLPIIAGLSYELLKLSAKYPKNWFFKLISRPGLWMQKLTTSEPTADMLEVSLNSLKLALQAEENLKQNHGTATATVL